MNEFMDAAIAEARLGRDAGGVPIGSVLVHDGVIFASGALNPMPAGWNGMAAAGIFEPWCWLSVMGARPAGVRS